MRTGYGRSFVQVLDETIAAVHASGGPASPAQTRTSASAPAAFHHPWGGVQTVPLYAASAATAPPSSRTRWTGVATATQPEAAAAPITTGAPVGEAPIASSPAAPGTAPAMTPPMPPAAPIRRARRLTSRQQQALGRLVEMGASLTDGFSDADLRRVSRTLAQRFHPDRHPGAGPHELARLTRLFSEAREACAELASALPPAA